MYLFSIIVPVYNVEQYLDECIQSLIDQTYKNFELILVNDGSSDSSGILCDRYKEKDCRVCVIHKTNGGLSSARNAGLWRARGDYVLYVDADDYISLDFLERVAEKLTAKPFDMVVGDTVFFVDGRKPKISNVQKKEQILTPEEALESVFYQEFFDTNACAKVMKKEIARMHPFVDGILYEDFKNIYKFIAACEQVLYFPESRYYYRQRANSIMNSAFDERKWVLIDIAEENLDFVTERYPDITDAAIRRYVYSNFRILRIVVWISGMQKQSEELRGNILKYKKNLLANKRVGIQEKLSVCILSLGLKPYKFFLYVYCRLKGQSV